MAAVMMMGSPQADALVDYHYGKIDFTGNDQLITRL